MKKLTITLFLAILLLTSCVCDKDAAILLSTDPIDPKNFSFEDKYPVFKRGQKIYYILVSKEPIENEKLRLQVLKIEKIAQPFKIEPAYGIDINRGREKHYVTDYFVLHKAGTYFVRIFSFDNLKLPLAETEFEVIEK